MDSEQLRSFVVSEGSPLIANPDQPCAACHVQFVYGNRITLVYIGPGSDEEERRKAREGLPHTGTAVPVHWACATGWE